MLENSLCNGEPGVEVGCVSYDGDAVVVVGDVTIDCDCIVANQYSL